MEDQQWPAQNIYPETLAFLECNPYYIIDLFQAFVRPPTTKKLPQKGWSCSFMVFHNIILSRNHYPEMTLFVHPVIKSRLRASTAKNIARSS
jgi:hypothetical protein